MVYGRYQQYFAVKELAVLFELGSDGSDGSDLSLAHTATMGAGARATSHQSLRQRFPSLPGQGLQSANCQFLVYGNIVLGGFRCLFCCLLY